MISIVKVTMIEIRAISVRVAGIVGEIRNPACVGRVPVCASWLKTTKGKKTRNKWRNDYAGLKILHWRAETF